MNVLLKSLIVWLLLLAVPFQGVASATMLVCAPIGAGFAAMPGATAPAAAHDHQAMLAAQRAPHHHPGAVARTAEPGAAAAGHHVDGKCNACAACCLGVAMAPPHVAPMGMEPLFFHPVASTDGFMPSVDSALPERPPQGTLA